MCAGEQIGCRTVPFTIPWTDFTKFCMQLGNVASSILNVCVTNWM